MASVLFYFLLHHCMTMAIQIAIQFKCFVTDRNTSLALSLHTLLMSLVIQKAINGQRLKILYNLYRTVLCKKNIKIQTNSSVTMEITFKADFITEMTQIQQK